MGLETDALIVSLAGARHGAIAFQSLIEAGITASSIRRRVGGVLQPFAKGVYLVGPMTSEGLLPAALMATPGSVARLWRTVPAISSKSRARSWQALWIACSSPAVCSPS